MITTKLKGGLGNQMFQYATGKAFSIKNNADLSFFDATQKNNGDTERNYELNKFNVDITESNKFKNNFCYRLFKRHHLDYHPDLINKITGRLSQNKDVFLDGFFQSEKNFSSIRDILLTEFTLKPEFKSPKFIELSEQILTNQNSVSIHIRRGDYVNNSSTNKYHGTCSLSYYKSAVELIKEKIGNEKNIIFYIFSDDPEWANSNLNIPNSKIISGQGLSFQEEMILMSQCKHNIIANSSFSWWGAWLNQNDDKIVIAPTPWVDKKPNPHPNILPETWLTLPKN